MIKKKQSYIRRTTSAMHITFVPTPYRHLIEPEENFSKLLPFALNFDEAQYGQPDLQGSHPALLHDLSNLKELTCQLPAEMFNQSRHRRDKKEPADLEHQ